MARTKKKNINIDTDAAPNKKVVRKKTNRAKPSARGKRSSSSKIDSIFGALGKRRNTNKRVIQRRQDEPNALRDDGDSGERSTSKQRYGRDKDRQQAPDERSKKRKFKPEPLKKKTKYYAAQLPSSPAPSLRTVPWNRSPNINHDRQQRSIRKTNKTNSVGGSGGDSTGTHPVTSKLPRRFLQRLNDELRQFASYVRLNETECRARRTLIAHFETTAQTLFANQRRHTRFNNDDNQQPPVTCKVFGSFAALSVCTYASDVDLALYGVVPPSAPKRNIAVNTINATKKSTTTANSSTTSDTKQIKLQKWKDALAAVDAANESTHGSSGSDYDAEARDPSAAAISDTPSETLCTNGSNEKDIKRTDDNDEADGDIRAAGSFCVAPACDEPVASGEQVIVKSATTTVMTKITAGGVPQVSDNINEPSAAIAASQDVAVVESTALAATAVKAPAEDSLFVIDRVGDPSLAASPQEITKTGTNNVVIPESITASATTTTPVSQSSSSSSVVLGDSKETAIFIDSDDDSADKMEAFRGADAMGPAAEKRRYSCSSDSDEEDDYDDDGATILDDSDNNDIEVGFFSGPRPAVAPSSAGPQGWVRTEVVTALASFSNKLRKSKLTKNVQLIKGARVPIIKVDTCLGFEADIAVGGHNGTDTSLYAASQVENFESFSVVILFLKVLLSQQKLDRPFTGGLGSYKLYVLLAYHINKHLNLGGFDQPGEVLLSFLYRYGCVGDDGKDPIHTTVLNQDVPLCGADGASADLSNVFKLDECVHLFRLCRDRLWGRIHRPDNNEGSLLAELIHPIKLQIDRSTRLQKLKQSVSKLKGLQNERALPVAIASKPSPNKRKAPPNNPTGQNSKAKKLRDLSAQELVASYYGNRFCSSMMDSKPLAAQR